MRQKRFPTLAIGLLLVGTIWLLNDLNVIAINIPWIPVVIIIIALGMFFNKYVGCYDV